MQAAWRCQPRAGSFRLLPTSPHTLGSLLRGGEAGLLELVLTLRFWGPSWAPAAGRFAQHNVCK